ncbi:MAG TPA: hypothetical protein VGK54_11135 [Chloroflexota bacterium]|jgi:hypothetical protein
MASGSLQGSGAMVAVHGDPWLVKTTTDAQNTQQTDTTVYVGGVLPIISPKVEVSTERSKPA